MWLSAATRYTGSLTDVAAEVRVVQGTGPAKTLAFKVATRVSQSCACPYSQHRHH